MADITTIIPRISDILYSGVFGVAKYEPEITFSKFKMADPIWRTSNEKF